MSTVHPVLKNRDRYGYISVPIGNSPTLCWVRLERLQPTCRAAGIKFAEALLGWERSGSFSRPVTEGVVVARRDVPHLAEAVAASSRERARHDAVQVARELARDLMSRISEIHTAVWADANDSKHPKIASMFRRFLCPSYPQTTSDREKLARILQAVGYGRPAVELVDRLITSEVDLDTLQRAKILSETKGSQFTRQEVAEVFRRNLDDTWSTDVDLSGISPVDQLARLVPTVRRLSRKQLSADDLLMRVLDVIAP
ncbi:hypothetical protein BH11PLA2_BH11PLA2_16130 [soil metagenome]